MRKEIEIKVCGMRDGKNILDVSRLRPAYMGFIFYAQSPRYVGEDFVIPEDFPQTTRRVGVFVNETSGAILRKKTEYGLDFVQLHGDEPVAQCSDLKATGLGIIKVFSVSDHFDFSVTGPYRDVVDYFLFDTRGKFYGGNSKIFDWKLLSGYDQKVPFFLSGGITPGHIQEIKTLNDFNLVAIDVNSGVEIRPGFKDIKKIEAIKSILNSKS
jgi:phosphoribosylanthranilate isomerase